MPAETRRVYCRHLSALASTCAPPPVPSPAAIAAACIIYSRNSGSGSSNGRSASTQRNAARQLVRPISWLPASRSTATPHGAAPTGRQTHVSRVGGVRTRVSSATEPTPSGVGFGDERTARDTERHRRAVRRITDDTGARGTSGSEPICRCQPPGVTEREARRPSRAGLYRHGTRRPLASTSGLRRRFQSINTVAG